MDGFLKTGKLGSTSSNLFSRSEVSKAKDEEESFTPWVEK